MKDIIEWDPVFEHRVERVELSRRLIAIEDVKTHLKSLRYTKKQYNQLLLEIKKNPEIKKKPRWYVNISRHIR